MYVQYTLYFVGSFNLLRKRFSIKNKLNIHHSVFTNRSWYCWNELSIFTERLIRCCHHDEERNRSIWSTITLHLSTERMGISLHQ